MAGATRKDLKAAGGTWGVFPGGALVAVADVHSAAHVES